MTQRGRGDDSELRDWPSIHTLSGVGAFVVLTAIALQMGSLFLGLAGGFGFGLLLELVGWLLHWRGRDKQSSDGQDL